MNCWLTFVFPKAEDWRFNELGLSVLSAARHYDVHVVTSLASEVELMGLPCQIHTRPFDDARPWSVHKLRTYAEAPAGQPFLHIDSDVFLFHPLPELVLGFPLFAQSPEGPEHYSARIGQRWSDRYAPDPHLAFNMGIFGGIPSLVREYARMGLEAAIAGAPGPTYAEQFVLGRFAQNHAVMVGTLFDEGEKPPAGYTHLMQASADPAVRRRVARRYASERVA